MYFRDTYKFSSPSRSTFGKQASLSTCSNKDFLLLLIRASNRLLAFWYTSFWAQLFEFPPLS